MENFTKESSVRTRSAQQNLYVMQAASGRLKIGRSGNVEARRHALETGSGERIVVLAILPGRGSEERAVHAKLAIHRGLGEWFDCNADVVEILGIELGVPISIKFGDLSPLGRAREAKYKKIARQRTEAAEAAVDALIAEIAAGGLKGKRRKRQTVSHSVHRSPE